MGGIIFTIVMGAILVGMIVLFFVSRILVKKHGEAFQAAHPEAVKVYETGVHAKAITTTFADSAEGKYSFFRDTDKQTGFMLLPGERYDMRFECTISYGVVKKTLRGSISGFVPKAGQSYSLMVENNEFLLR